MNLTALRRLAVMALVSIGACAPASTTTRAGIDPGARTLPEMGIRADSIPDPYAGRAPAIPPSVALQRGLMPLAATAADSFRRANPSYDGRGVLVAVLDGGVDPAVPGLLTTTTGAPKILDARDFSGEGRIALAPATMANDTVVVAGFRLVGLASDAPVFTGVLRELPLGPLPASDVNGDGDAADSLPLVVTRAGADWIVLADTDGDGTLADERPVRDYLVARETFGWSAAGRPAQLTIAANFGADAEHPELDLYFDTSGHGTHVAGIAAGHRIAGIDGFDGVAPGAQVLGLKIANDAQGGISTTGAMIRAAAYAVEFARARRMPLVLNLSFGVGNEIEGGARIDQLFDSLLAAHPDVILSVSAGNDGPGLSTLGFPGSAARGISVGATLPSAFLPASGPAAPDRVIYFSSRGGELAKPDVVAPGVAYSTVPRWHTGQEQKGGTSMAAPHVSGLVALLLSATDQERRAVAADEVRQALMATAEPARGRSYLDTGAGTPHVQRALAWLQRHDSLPRISVRVRGGQGVTAAVRRSGLASPADTVQRFELRAEKGTAPLRLTLRSDAPWLRAPESVRVGAGPAAVTLRYDAAALDEPGVHTAVVTGWAADSTLGPIVRLVNTVVVPHPAGDVTVPPRALEPAAVVRTFFVVDSARPFDATVIADGPASAHLFEPGGAPYRGGDPHASQAQQGQGITFAVDARDAVPGVYELVAAASPVAGTSAAVRIGQSPLALRAARDREGVTATLENRTDAPVTAEAALLLVGAERALTVAARGSAPYRIPFRVPAWARAATIDVSMDPEQWGRFTDFGVTLFDSAGRQIESSPQNYAVGRLEAEFAEGGAERAVELALFPGFADSAAAGGWSAHVSIRLYGDSAQTLDVRGASAGPATVSVAAGGRATVAFDPIDHSWPAGDGFFPLGVLAARVGEHVWTREVGLTEPQPPVMR